MKYKRINAGDHYRVPNIISFTDECLDGPNQANHMRYVLEVKGTQGAIKSFEVAKKVSMLGKKFGDITNSVMADESRSEAELRELGILEYDGKKVTTDYHQFIMTVCQQLGGKSTVTAQDMMKDLEMDMGVNAFRIKTNAVTHFEFPEPSLISAVDVVRSTDRNGGNPEIKLNNITVNLAPLIGEGYERYQALSAIEFTRQFYENTPKADKDFYYAVNDKHRALIKAFEQDAGIQIYRDLQNAREWGDRNSVLAYLQKHSSAELYAQFAAAIAIEEQSDRPSLTTA